MVNEDYREPPMIPYDLTRSFAPEEPNLVLPFDKNMDPVKEGETPVGVLKFYIRPLTGGDEVKINDKLIQLNKGKGDVLSGTSEMLKATRSVVRIEGLADERGPVPKLGEKTFGKLKSWVTDALKTKIRELNKSLDTEDADQE